MNSKFILKNIPFWAILGWILGAITFFFYLFSKISPYNFEKLYGYELYPFIAQKLSTVSHLIPFSLTHLSLIYFMFMMLLSAFCFVKAFFLRGDRKRNVILGFIKSVGLLGILLSWYLWFWGLNFLRPQITESFDLNHKVAENHREEILQWIVEKTNSSRENLEEDENACVKMEDDLSVIDEIIEPLQRELISDFGFPEFSATPTKKLMFSSLSLQLGIAGMYGPLTGERNIAWPMAPGTQAFIVAHERAHFAGFTSEAEANFLGLLTVLKSSSPKIQYSGWLGFWMLIPSEKLSSYAISDSVKRDLSCLKSFYKKHEGVGAKLQSKLYDAWLKLNGIESGMDNYNEAVDLLVSFFDKDKNRNFKKFIENNHQRLNLNYEK